MVNEFHQRLDSNGYIPSIIHNEGTCICCGTTLNLCRHEVFHGYANRRKSKELGLWVNVCPVCHMKIHNTDGELDLTLKKRGQECAMAFYDWTIDDFRKRFGRNYV